MNKIQFTGRLTADPEIKRTQDGKPVVRFRFAVNRTYKRENEPEADFFNMVCFGTTAERFEKLNIQKGTKLLLEGDVRNNNYTDKDGVKHYDYQFTVNTFEFLESKNASNSAPAPQTVNTTTVDRKAENDGFMMITDGVNDEELPFN